MSERLSPSMEDVEFVAPKTDIREIEPTAEIENDTSAQQPAILEKKEVERRQLISQAIFVDMIVIPKTEGERNYEEELKRLDNFKTYEDIPTSFIPSLERAYYEEFSVNKEGEEIKINSPEFPYIGEYTITKIEGEISSVISNGPKQLLVLLFRDQDLIGSATKEAIPYLTKKYPDLHIRTLGYNEKKITDDGKTLQPGGHKIKGLAGSNIPIGKNGPLPPAFEQIQDEPEKNENSFANLPELKPISELK